MYAAELGAGHGYASVMVKGHAKERNRFWRKAFHAEPSQTGQPNLAGWSQLAAFFEKGGGVVQRGGDRLVQ